MTPKRAAMAGTVAPSCASRLNATTWSAGCIAMRTTFSASESSPALPFAAILQGTGWSASRVPSSASAFSAARRRPPATTAKRSAPSSAGSSARATRFSSSPCDLMEATSWASAASSGEVLRTFSGASASRQSGMSRIAGWGGGAMWFMRISVDGWTDAGGNGPLGPARVRPGRARLRLGLPLPRCRGASGGPAGAAPGGVVRGRAGAGCIRPPGGLGRRIGPVGGFVEEARGLAQRVRGVSHAAGADYGFGREVGVGGPRYPEREFGQGLESLPQRLRWRAVDRACHGRVLRSGAMSMRSPQGSRFHSDGGLE